VHPYSTPEILFLDEPTTALIRCRAGVLGNSVRFKKTGITIIVSTPYMDEAQRCANCCFFTMGDYETSSPDDLLGAYPCKLFSVESGEGPLSCAHDAISPI